MVNKPVKMFDIIGHQEMQMKTTIRHHFIPSRIAIVISLKKMVRMADLQPYMLLVALVK